MLASLLQANAGKTPLDAVLQHLDATLLRSGSYLIRLLPSPRPLNRFETLTGTPSGQLRDRSRNTEGTLKVRLRQIPGHRREELTGSNCLGAVPIWGEHEKTVGRVKGPLRSATADLFQGGDILIGILPQRR
jgi:hypothetical protein